MTIAREEIFGPVLATIEFADVDEAIARANDSSYGLAAAVWTKDIKKAHYVARKLQAEINERWLSRLDALIAQSDPEQEALDVDQEARAYRACRSEIAEVIKAIR